MKAAFTIATANYLAQAKTVADSFLYYNPDYKFVIYLLDKINNRFDTDYFAPAELIEVEALEIDCFPDMVERYAIFELSNALKPFVAEHLLLRKGEVDTILYFDSDVAIYHSLNEIDEFLKTFAIVLSPHVLTPMPLDDLAANERTFLNSGIYNGGFFAIKRSEEALSFLSWWKERLKKYCLIDFSNGLFVDQIWLNLVPVYFGNCHIIRNPGYNVAYWNLYERTVQRSNIKYTINEHYPLLFFHFSGYSFNQPESISKYQTRYTFAQRPDIVSLYDDYRKLVLGNGYQVFSALECYYVHLKQKMQAEKNATEIIKVNSVKRIVRVLKRKTRNIIRAILS